MFKKQRQRKSNEKEIRHVKARKEWRSRPLIPLKKTKKNNDNLVPKQAHDLLVKN